MTRVRYAFYADGTDLWRNVAEVLGVGHGFDPAIWFGHPSHLEHAGQRFPGCELLDERLLDSGDFPRDQGTGLPLEIRESLPFQRATLAALDSLQRNEVHREVPYLARRTFLSVLAEHLWFHLSDREVTHVVAAQAPHSPSGLLFAGLVEAAGLPMMHFQHSTIGPYSFPRTGPSYEPVDLVDLSRQGRIRQPPREEVRHWVEDFVSRASGHQLPEIDAQVYSASQGYRGLIGLGRDLRNTRRSLRRTQGRSTSVSIGPIESRRFAGIPTAVESVRSRRRRSAALIRVHQAVLHRDELPDRFWLMLLHYEPEKSTNPDGGENRDQLAFIRAVARQLPSDTMLVIREHPAQFTLSKVGFAGRHPSFYEEVASVSGVLVADPSISNWELLDRSLLVFTVTGTIGLEALVTGRPVVHAGLPWYRGLPGTFHARDLSVISDTIELALASPPVGDVSELLASAIGDGALEAVITPGVVRLYEGLGWQVKQDSASVAEVIAQFLRK